MAFAPIRNHASANGSAARAAVWAKTKPKRGGYGNTLASSLARKLLDPFSGSGGFGDSTVLQGRVNRRDDNHARNSRDHRRTGRLRPHIPSGRVLHHLGTPLRPGKPQVQAAVAPTHQGTLMSW